MILLLASLLLLVFAHVVCGDFVIRPGVKVIKLLSCSTQLSMKFILLINVKMPTIVEILTLMKKDKCII